ncbi:MAG: Cyclic-di-AMP phosphodiesterase PgpH [Firmicutes bacterium]|nr:Cyclic-di-AMP phosphodiesterase PgpH [Bacillota bacterium]
MSYLSLERLWRALKGQTLWQRGLLLVAVYTITALVLVLTLVPEAVDLEVGQASPHYIGAPRMVEDAFTTALLRRQAAQGVAEVFEQDPTVIERVSREAESILNFFVQTAQNEPDAGRRAEAVRARLTFAITDGALTTGLTLDAGSVEQLLAEFRLALGPVYRLGIKADGLESARAAAVTVLQNSGLRDSYRTLVSEVARGIMLPNMRFHEAATERLRIEAVARVNPVMVQIGEKVIGQGEIATEREIMLLQALGLLRRTFEWRVISGSFLFALIAVGVPSLYFYRTYPHSIRTGVELTLIAVVYVGALGIGLGLSTLSGYLFPTAGASILLTVLLSPKVGLSVGCALSLLMVGLVGYEVRYLMVGLLGTVVGVYSATTQEHRGGLARTGMAVGLVNVLAIAALGLLFGGLGPQVLIDLVWGLAGGLLSSVLAIGFLPFLEHAFGVTSSVRLVELSNPHQPLLKRLLIEAPGTYHHSAIVANLAEAAALEVKANALLVRAGAYYHDVGKLMRPYFFIENQIMMDNPHNQYPPQVSAAVIISHVNDGVRLAREHKIPSVLIDFIKEHHGTSMVQYFFAKAQEQSQVVETADYSYEGPRPRTKESAIVMLADMVEAAVRASKMPTPAKVAERVHGLIRERLYAGQLDESELTLRELDKIGTAFVRILSGVFHHRIEYPGQQGGLKNAGAVDERAGQVPPTPSSTGANG